MNRSLDFDESGEPASVTIQLPEEPPVWDDSTVFLQQIHDALVAKGWAATGPR